MWIDSHCHIYMDDFSADLDAMLERAWQAGLEEIVVPSENLETSLKIARLCSTDKRLRPACGIHPHDAGTLNDAVLEGLRELAAKPETVAVGEIGLDYYRMHTPRDVQIKCLQALLGLALETGKPVIIHNRESGCDMLEILRPACAKGLRGVIHCFSGDADFARACLDLGFYISFAGQVTYPKAEELRLAAAVVPLDRLMLETDAPFLSPQKMRGKRNEPAHMLHTAERIAQIKEVPLEEIARATRDNARRLFNLA